MIISKVLKEEGPVLRGKFLNLMILIGHVYKNVNKYCSLSGVIIVTKHCCVMPKSIILIKGAMELHFTHYL